ncbi:hypothetical protein BBJ28_00009607 [Nothophytophthora sp. Chile5]|nr:hypothetical protein BBJ28_00009607 [Nothophytophthora sp. Chile5]
MLSTEATGSEELVLSVPLSRLAHQSRLHFQASDGAATHVEIVPVLSAADFAMRVFAPSGSDVDAESLFAIQEELATGSSGGAESVTTLRIAKNDGSPTATRVQLMLPHLIHLNVSVVHGGVAIQDKVEGDVKVVVGRGPIVVNKLRGKELSLKTNDGSIRVASLVEGETVKLEAANSVNCKRLMAGKAEVKLGKGDPEAESDFGAIYAAACSITSATQSGQSLLRVGNMHGYLRVVGEGLKRVHVDSISGAMDLEDSGDKCEAEAHFDSWTDDASSSILVGGDVRVSLQPAAAIGVELHGTNVTVGEGCAFASSELDQLDEDYAVFTGELIAQEGTVAAAAPSSGKINVGGAKEDAMRTSFFMNERAGDDDDADEEEQQPRTPRLFVHALSGQVTLEQLDWMANLKRQHLKR